MIRILYFASLRERLQTESEALALPTEDVTIASLIAHLRARGGRWAESFGEGERLLAAVNQELASLHTPIRDGDEVAFFPPVTGG